MRTAKKNAILSHEVVSGMEGRITVLQLLNNAFPDRLGYCQFHSEDSLSSEALIRNISDVLVETIQ